MHDPFAWSFPIGRLFGITMRIHWLFPFVAVGLILQAAFYTAPNYVPPDGTWIDASILMLILFVSTLLHEFGHAFAARACGGDCQEVLLWPLGGLAAVEVPHRPRAHFLTAAAGPAVDFLICLAAVVGLLLVGGPASSPGSPIQPVWNPFPDASGLWRVSRNEVLLTNWAGATVSLSPYEIQVWLARIFWVNWFLGLLNVVVAGFPLDGGRMLQAALWPSMGYRQSMLTAVFVGFGAVFVVGLFWIIKNSSVALGLALFIYVSCQRQWIVLETGGEEGALGYDFSQGYTSLERDHLQAAPPQPRLSWWRRWMQRRAQRRLQRDMEQREAEERRMDELLEKLHREGRQSLTEEEERFMKRVSDRYRRQGGH